MQGWHANSASVVIVVFLLSGCTFTAPGPSNVAPSVEAKIDPAADPTLWHDSCGLVSMVTSADDSRWQASDNPTAYRVNLQDSHVVRWRIVDTWIAIEVEVGPSVFRPFERPLINRIYPNETAQNIIFYNLESLEASEAGPCMHSMDPYMCSAYRLKYSSNSYFLYNRPLTQKCQDGKSDMVVRHAPSDAEIVVHSPLREVDENLIFEPIFTDGHWIIYDAKPPRGYETSLSGRYVQNIMNETYYRIPTPNGTFFSDVCCDKPLAIYNNRIYYGVTDSFYIEGPSTAEDAALMEFDILNNTSHTLLELKRPPIRVQAANSDWILWSESLKSSRPTQHALNIHTGNWFTLHSLEPFVYGSYLIGNYAFLFASGSHNLSFDDGIYRFDLQNQEHSLLIEYGKVLEFGNPEISEDGFIAKFYSLIHPDGTRNPSGAALVWIPMQTSLQTV